MTPEPQCGCYVRWSSSSLVRRTLPHPALLVIYTNISTVRDVRWKVCSAELYSLRQALDMCNLAQLGGKHPKSSIEIWE